MAYEKRTDLALEVRESFPEDRVEVEGVVLEKERYGEIMVTTVEIKNDRGARQMKKPVGSYVTLEFPLTQYQSDESLKNRKRVIRELKKTLGKMMQQIEKRNSEKPLILVSGLGNRFATPDALGPYVLENIPMNRHIRREFGDITAIGGTVLCGISPGVMSQTGMESREILKGIADRVRPDALFVIDALASRSVKRLCRTIQVTNTGISPGAGIGNNRNQISQETIGIPVIAIGVPTVVDAGTIIYEALENALTKEGYQEEEIYSFFRSIAGREARDLFVTPKDIDEEIREVGKMIALGISGYAKENVPSVKNIHTTVKGGIE